MNITEVCNLYSHGEGNYEKALGTFYLNQGAKSSCISFDCVLPNHAAPARSQYVRLGLKVYEVRGVEELPVCLGSEFYSCAVAEFWENTNAGWVKVTKPFSKVQSLKPFLFFTDPAHHLAVCKANIQVHPCEEMTEKNIFFRIYLETDSVCYHADTPVFAISRKRSTHQPSETGLLKNIQKLVNDSAGEKVFQQQGKHRLLSFERQLDLCKDKYRIAVERSEKGHCCDCFCELTDDAFVRVTFWTGSNKAFYKNWCAPCFKVSAQEKIEKIFRYYEQDKFNGLSEGRIVVHEQLNQSPSFVILKDLRAQFASTRPLTEKHGGLPDGGAKTKLDSIKKFEETNLPRANNNEEETEDTILHEMEKEIVLGQAPDTENVPAEKELGTPGRRNLSSLGVDAAHSESPGQGDYASTMDKAAAEGEVETSGRQASLAPGVGADRVGQTLSMAQVTTEKGVEAPEQQVPGSQDEVVSTSDVETALLEKEVEKSVGQQVSVSVDTIAACKSSGSQCEGGHAATTENALHEKEVGLFHENEVGLPENDASSSECGVSRENVGRAATLEKVTVERVQGSLSSCGASQAEEVELLERPVSVFVGQYVYNVWTGESEISGKCTAARREFAQEQAAYNDAQNNDCTYTGKGPLPIKMDGKVFDITTKRSCKEENTEFRFYEKRDETGTLHILGHGKDKFGNFRIEGLMALNREKCTGDVTFLKIYKPKFKRNKKKRKKLQDQLSRLEGEGASETSIAMIESRLQDHQDGIKLSWQFDEKVQLAYDLEDVKQKIPDNKMSNMVLNLIERDILNITDGEKEFKNINDMWCLGKLDNYFKKIKIMLANGEKMCWSDNDLVQLWEMAEDVPGDQQSEMAHVIMKHNPHFWKLEGDEHSLELYSLVSLHELDKFVKTVKQQRELLASSKNMRKTTCLHCHEPLALKENAMIVCSKHCEPYRMHTCCWKKLSSNKETATCPGCLHGSLSGTKTRRLKDIQQPTQEPMPKETTAPDTKNKILGLLTKLKDAVSEALLKRWIASLDTVVKNTAPETIHYRWGVQRTNVLRRIFRHTLFAPGGTSTAKPNEKKRKAAAEETAENKSKKMKTVSRSVTETQLRCQKRKNWGKFNLSKKYLTSHKGERLDSYLPKIINALQSRLIGLQDKVLKLKSLPLYSTQNDANVGEPYCRLTPGVRFKTRDDAEAWRKGQLEIDTKRIIDVETCLHFVNNRKAKKTHKALVEAANFVSDNDIFLFEILEELWHMELKRNAGKFSHKSSRVGPQYQAAIPPYDGLARSPPVAPRVVSQPEPPVASRVVSLPEPPVAPRVEPQPEPRVPLFQPGAKTCSI
jgi:hypothetical protein